MKELIFISALIAVIPASSMACPMAGKTYAIKIAGYANATLFIDAACEKMTVDYWEGDYTIELTPEDGGWKAVEPRGQSYWFFRSNAKSVRIVGNGWRRNIALKPAKP